MLHLLYLMMSSLKKLLSPNKKGEELAAQKLRRWVRIPTPVIL